MREEEFTIAASDGGEIRGVSLLPDRPWERPLVIFIHGFMGHKNWSFWPYLSDKLAAIGVATIRFDLSTSGVGPGSDHIDDPERFRRATITRDLEDIKTVIDAVFSGSIPLSKYADKHKIALLGHSRGAGLALLTAVRDSRVSALVSIAGPADFARFDDEVMAKWKSDGYLEFLDPATGNMLPIDYAIAADYEEHAEEYNLVEAAKRLAIPLLLVHGEDDDEVPAVESKILAEAAPSATWTNFIKGAGHLFNSDIIFSEPSPELDRAVEAVYDFLLRHYF